MKKFILIGHEKQHGKDTFAKMLQYHLGNAEILSFADPMREILADTFGMSVEEYKEYYTMNPEERKKIQRFGSNKMVEFFGETVWRDVLLKRAEKSKCEYIIVPDFRFYREKIAGAFTLKLFNPRIPKSDDNHASERELDDFIWGTTITNDSSLEDLYDKAGYYANFVSEKPVYLKEAPSCEAKKFSYFTISDSEQIQSEDERFRKVMETFEALATEVLSSKREVRFIVLCDYLNTDGKVCFQGESHES